MIHTVLIASYLEPEHVGRIRAFDSRLDVIYEPDLLRAPRYAADHTGAALTRTAEQEARWQSLLGRAEILFDFDQTHPADLPELAPRVRWVQATSAGIGQFVKRMGYDTRMPDTVFTTAAGVHAQPLAEFCIMVMLVFRKGLLRALDDQRRRHWERYAGTDLAGRTLVIVGVGAVGREVARVGRALGMRVIGVGRAASPSDAVSRWLDEYHSVGRLRDVLPRAEHLVLVAPHTPATEGLIGAAELARLPKAAILINIARGALVDEDALIAALRAGQLAGAGLDVFAHEPLPADSPLWGMPNVFVSPHSGSTSDRENDRLTDLFCDNLRRYLAGEPLRNVFDVERSY